MFRRLFTLLVLGSVFVGGYYVGRLPGSPDIFAWAQRAYQQASEASYAVRDAVSDHAGQGHAPKGLDMAAQGNALGAELDGVSQP